MSTATEHPSVCTLDCPDTCSLSVSVADGRISQIAHKWQTETRVD